MQKAIIGGRYGDGKSEKEEKEKIEGKKPSTSLKNY